MILANGPIQTNEDASGDAADEAPAPVRTVTIENCDLTLDELYRQLQEVREWRVGDDEPYSSAQLRILEDGKVLAVLETDADGNLIKQEASAVPPPHLAGESVVAPAWPIVSPIVRHFARLQLRDAVDVLQCAQSRRAEIRELVNLSRAESDALAVVDDHADWTIYFARRSIIGTLLALHGDMKPGDDLASHRDWSYCGAIVEVMGEDVLVMIEPDEDKELGLAEDAFIRVIDLSRVEDLRTSRIVDGLGRDASPVHEAADAG